MREEEVSNIFGENWAATTSLNDALMQSSRQIGEIILAKISPPLDNNAQKMLLKMNEARSHLQYLVPLANLLANSLNHPILNEKDATSLNCTYEALETALRYIHDHYEDMPEKFSQENSKENFGRTINLFTQRIEKAVNPEVFKLMENTFNLVMYQILGNDAYQEFMAEFNEAMAVLRRYQAQMKSYEKNGNIRVFA